jgi:beta-alanine--pyruvate transaminase
VAGSTGVLVPPKGYLERVRRICDKYGLLLIFDEVITGFGRLGKAFASEHFNIVPDMITCAKGITNGTIPMGAVIARKGIYDALMNAPENTIEFYHGYTYSGHPVAAAAAIATLDLYAEEGLFQRAAELADYFADAVHSLRSLPHVIDIRNLGLVAGIELESIPEKPSARAFDCFMRCFEQGVLIRVTGDIIALSPPLIIEKGQIDELIDKLANVLRKTK